MMDAFEPPPILPSIAGVYLDGKYGTGVCVGIIILSSLCGGGGV